jgi:hypothetical protein
LQIEREETVCPIAASVVQGSSNEDRATNGCLIENNYSSDDFDTSVNDSSSEDDDTSDHDEASDDDDSREVVKSTSYNQTACNEFAQEIEYQVC